MATYTVQVAPTNDTLAHTAAWPLFFGGGLSYLGWLPVTGHGELVATGSGGSYAWTNNNVLPGTTITACASYTFRGAWVSGTTYVGGNGSASVADLVTFTGSNDQPITNGVVSGNNTAVLSIANTVGFTVGQSFTPNSITTSAFTQLNGKTFTITSIAANTSVTGTYGPAGLTNQTTLACDGRCVSSVTLGIQTYVHITASTSLATPPCGDITNWIVYNYEIWKSNGPMSSSLPIYLRFVYTSANVGPSPRILFAIGTGVDVNGNLTGAIPITTSAPTTNMNLDSSASSSSTGTCNMSGDADNVRFCAWRDGPAAGYAQLLVIDRAKTASGADSDSYFYFGRCFNVSGTAESRACVQLNNALGGSVILNTGGTTNGTGWPGVVSMAGNINVSVASLIFGSIAPQPVFPPIGYLANPLLGCVGWPADLVTNGSVQSCWLYGQSHNYLVCKPGVTAGFQMESVATHTSTPSILWE